MEDKGFYAMRWTGDGELCRVLTSNPGHLLFASSWRRSGRARSPKRLLGRSSPRLGVRTLVCARRGTIR